VIETVSLAYSYIADCLLYRWRGLMWWPDLPAHSDRLQLGTYSGPSVVTRASRLARSRLAGSMSTRFTLRRSMSIWRAIARWLVPSERTVRELMSFSSAGLG
jgi:hypothetical protein